MQLVIRRRATSTRLKTFEKLVDSEEGTSVGELNRELILN